MLPLKLKVVVSLQDFQFQLRYFKVKRKRGNQNFSKVSIKIPLLLTWLAV